MAMSVENAARHCGLGRSSLYNAIAAGKLIATRAGRRTLVRMENLDAWLRSLDAPPAAKILPNRPIVAKTQRTQS